MPPADPGASHPTRPETRAREKRTRRGGDPDPRLERAVPDHHDQSVRQEGDPDAPVD